MIGGTHVLANASWLDPVGGLVISLMVVQAGWGNTRDSLLELADAGADEPLKRKVSRATDAALGEAGAAHDTNVRQVQGVKAGQNYLVDVELGVPGAWSVAECRGVEEAVRARVGAKVRGVKRVRVRFVPRERVGAAPELEDEFVAPGESPRSSPEPEEGGEDGHAHRH